jgi:DNA-binding GntR family transcriptional regulator
MCVSHERGTRVSEPREHRLRTRLDSEARRRDGQTLVEQAHECLEELIVTLKLPPGSLWSEGALSELTGIGRTPVREAIHRLSAAHLMQIVPRHGVLVSQVDISEQLLVLELRRELERLVAMAAARRASAAERAKIPAMADAMEHAGNMGSVIAYLRSLFVTNRYFALCSRNTYAAEAIAPLHTLSRRFYFVHHLELNDLKIAGRLHAIVARAVAAGDEREAALASDRMMDYVEDFTRRLISSKTDNPGRKAIARAAGGEPGSAGRRSNLRAARN